MSTSTASTPSQGTDSPSSIPATPLQAGMLFHAATHPSTGVDTEQISIELNEALDVERFRSAWQIVFDRNPILSARFAWRDRAQPTLELDKPEGVVFETEDWTNEPTDQIQAKIERTRLADRVVDFDLEDGPIHRFLVAKIGADHWWVLWSFHHSVLDGRSFPIVLQDVFQLYDNNLNTAELPERVGFHEYATAMDAQDGRESREYWRSKFTEFETASSVPASVAAGSGQPKNTGPSVSFIETEIGVERTERLRALAESAGVSLNTCVQTAWVLLLAHYSQQPLVTFGTTRACRHAVPGSSDMIGLLINTVPMALPVDRTESVGDLLRRIRAEQYELRDHETTPLPTIAECSGADGDMFESIVVFDDASLGSRMGAAFPDHAETRHFRYDGQTNFPLTLLGYGDESMLVRLEYAVALYDDAYANIVFEHYLRLLDGLAAADRDQPAATVPYLTSAELAQFDEWNSTDADYDLETTLQAMFEAQVAATPDAPALVYGDKTLSYDEFNRRANKLANHLKDQGVGRDTPVGVFAERSFEMMIAIYAILKAGGGFVPLDPEHPVDRLTFMAEDSGIDLILTQAHLADGLPVDGVRLILADHPDQWANQSDQNPEAVSGPDDMAYVLYTSGSTGKPKGAIIEHRAIVNRLIWMQEAYPLNADDAVLQKTPYTFDVSVWELFWPMQVGAKLVMAEPGGHRDTAYLTETIERYNITTLHFVPSMLQLFVEEPTIGRCGSIVRIICSGEALPRSLQDRVFELLDTELHNLYGPTEAAIDVTWWACDAESPLDTVPIGYPIANTQVHILDPDLQQLPVGVAGELHIGGVQLARCYHNREELTAERFVPDPLSDRPGARLYKTGDLVRYLPDGAIEFLGRLDFQIKIRGQRIELGEIEAAITGHPEVRETVVTAVGKTAADTKLVAYVVGEASEETLREHCGQALAEYMVPSVWMFLDAFPLNSNGKVDRKLLPEPEVRSADREIVAAESDTEAQVLAIWAELLEDNNLSVTEKFFDVGGNSLLLITLAFHLAERFDKQITVTELVRFSTIRDQAMLVLGQTDDMEDAAVAAGAAAAKARRGRRGGRRPAPKV